jgi:hypothetical protein
MREYLTISKTFSLIGFFIFLLSLLLFLLFTKPPNIIVGLVNEVNVSDEIYIF